MDFLLVFQGGFTPLFIASQCNHLKVIELLLGAGANTDIANNVRKQYAKLRTVAHINWPRHLHVQCFRMYIHITQVSPFLPYNAVLSNLIA